LTDVLIPSDDRDLSEGDYIGATETSESNETTLFVDLDFRILPGAQWQKELSLPDRS
jgi:hypothetical protein